RIRQRDFDMVPSVYSAMPYPSPDLQIIWNSKYIDSSYNRPGVKDPAVDKLTDEIAANQGKQDALLALGHALDRVLTWNMYMIPMWYNNHQRYAYWDKFSMPSIQPMNGLELDTWWYDFNRANRLPAERR
ncbi:MAG: ABC transporter substrate-binding protein, partial [Ewingella sp.]|nr:ABC transporter substrate-binding protein [Ewingella sp.]